MADVSSTATLNVNVTGEESVKQLAARPALDRFCLNLAT